jgi:formylglycine-generating enzyme required for sulfatase activity
VIDVSWDDANQYLAWLAKKTRHRYRLLTEAEWEFAARAGTTTPYATGRTIITDQANFNGKAMHGESAKGQDRGSTIEVGSFAPNPFGLHDMHGNVREWVEDCYLANYTDGPTDGSARSVGSPVCPRVLRGGSWIDTPRSTRAAYRYRELPSRRSSTIGFWVARTLSP